MLWATWGLLGMAQIIVQRYLKIFWKVSMLLHRVIGSTMVITTVYCGYAFLRMTNWTLLDGLHPALGLSIVVGVVLVAIGGILARYKLENSSWATPDTLRLKLAHKTFGYLMIFAS
jgi:hypothetical protein